MYLLQRMIQWIKGWKEKLLSMGAKEILLKSTIQSMTVFAMLVFKIPKKLCKEMNDVMAWFWWGDSDEQKRMHWAVWCRLCVPKKLGGTGFIYLHAFNLAMLAKKSWHLITMPDSLCARVLQPIYYPNGNMLKAGPKKGSSFTWQCIVARLQVFKRGHI